MCSLENLGKTLAEQRYFVSTLITALLLMGPLGAISTKRMRAIRKACRIEKASNSELLGRLRDPFLKISLGVRIAVFLGIFLLVSAKPGLWESIALREHL
jgi:hypothetical protein